MPFLVCTFVFAIAFVFVFVQCYFLRDHVGDSFPGSEVYYAVSALAKHVHVDIYAHTLRQSARGNTQRIPAPTSSILIRLNYTAIVSDE